MATAMLQMVDNPAVKDREGKYRVVRIDAVKALKSWRQSLFSFEWLATDGSIRSLDDLPMQEHQKRIEIENLLKKGAAIERPVLGIGIMDNIEIGSGRATFLTLAAQGHKSIEVHIPISSEDDFRPFFAK